MKNDISKFLDDKSRIKIWPSKNEMKFEILSYLASKFECGRFYKGQEVNNIIEDWHTFGDYFLLRRGLIDHWLLSRTKNGARYWREEQSSLRSYSLADEKCKNGELDTENFKKYLELYLKYGSINDYDIEIMPSLYMYQNLVCDYFYQYYHSKYKNKNILLENAIFTYKQCKALSDIIEKGIVLA